MTEMLNRPGFPLRLSSEPDKKVPEVEDEEYELKWGEHNNQVINIFHQLCQVCHFTLYRFSVFKNYILNIF